MTRERAPYTKPSDASRLIACLAHPALSDATRTKFRDWLEKLQADPLHGLSSQQLDAVRGAERALGICDQAGRPQVASGAAQAARARRAMGVMNPDPNAYLAFLDGGARGSGAVARKLRAAARAEDASPTLDAFDADPASIPAGRYSVATEPGALPSWLAAPPGASAADRGLPLRPPRRA